MAREMKDSGIEWIGEIPKEWNIAPLKRFAKIQTGNTPSKADEALFYADEGTLWIKPDNLGTRFPITHTTEYLTPEGCNVARVMPPNTVYVCCIGSLGKVGYSLVECCCNQQINALVYNDRMYWKFGYYLTLAQESRYLLYGNGNVLQIINATNQGNIECVVPLIREQKNISFFLDRMCVELDNILEKTRASIEEYRKLKDAVITQTVTKGIRGDREMKDSDIEWIGEIPRDWEVNTAFQMFTQVKNKNIDLREKNLLSLSYGKIKQKSIDTVRGLLPENFEGYNIVEKEDIVLRLTDLQNDHKSLRVGFVTERGIVTSAYCTIRVKGVNNGKYLYFYLHSFDIAKGFYGMGAGVRQGLNWDGLKKLKIIVPSLEEQQEIVTYLDQKCSAIDNLIAKKEQYLSEIENYKKSLIYEYITGKKEVPQKYQA